MRAAIASMLVSGLVFAFAREVGAVPGFEDSARETRPGVFDYCAPVVTRPLRRWSDTKSCTQPWTPEAIAGGAEVVLLGEAERASAAGDALPAVDLCAAPQTLDSHARYARELHELAAARGRKLEIGVLTRFDLVSPLLASRPGFDATFVLVGAGTWAQLLDFFARDTSPDCAGGGCRFATGEVYSDAVDPTRIESLMARIDQTSGARTARSRVYYLERSRPGKQVFRATRSLADLSNPEYRAWRVSEARRDLALGGYDFVELSHKFHQYLPPEGRPRAHWIGSEAAPDVTALNALGDTLWTGRPVGYGYPEYVRGWHALAGELREAGVPYSVQISLAPWRGPRYDDPRSQDDENRLIREVARGARVVLLDWPERRRGEGDFEPVRAELERAGARVVAVETACGRPGSRLSAPGTRELR